MSASSKAFFVAFFRRLRMSASVAVGSSLRMAERNRTSWVLLKETSRTCDQQRDPNYSWPT